MNSISTASTGTKEICTAGNLKAVFRNRRGSTTTEYALLAATIGLVAMVSLAPFGSSLAQELSALSLDHLLRPASTDTTGGCRRVDWVETEVSLHHRRNVQPGLAPQ